MTNEICSICGLVKGKECPCGSMYMCNNAEGCDDCSHGLEKDEE